MAALCLSLVYLSVVVPGSSHHACMLSSTTEALPPPALRNTHLSAAAVFCILEEFPVSHPFSSLTLLYDFFFTAFIPLTYFYFCICAQNLYKFFFSRVLFSLFRVPRRSVPARSWPSLRLNGLPANLQRPSLKVCRA